MSAMPICSVTMPASGSSGEFVAVIAAEGFRPCRNTPAYAGMIRQDPPAPAIASVLQFNALQPVPRANAG
jgi:hypothetical protein